MPLQPEQLKELIISIPDEELQIILPAIYFHFEQNEKIFATATNQLLNTGKTRIKGLKLLNELLGRFSLELLSENSLKWVNQCILRHSQDGTKDIYFTTLARIIEVSQNAENFNKKLVSDYMYDIFKMCINSDIVPSLKLLELCMQKYPTWFGNHKPKIDLFLIRFLDTSCQGTVKNAANVFHFLQQTGGAGIEGINYTNNFLNQFKKLCKTIQSLYDVLFETIEEIDRSQVIESEIIKFPPFPIDASTTKIFELTTQRIINCLLYLRAMITKNYPAIKQIVPKYIVDLVSRGLAFHICLALEQISIEQQYLNLCLNRIQIQIFDLLRPLFLGHLGSLLPYSNTVVKLLTNVLKRTQDCDCFKTNLKYRKACYKSLNEWIKAIKSYKSSNLKILLPLLLKDSSPIKQSVELDVSRKNKGNKSNDKSINIEKFTKTSSYEQICIECCVNSLFTINSLLTITTIPPKLLQELSTFVIKTVAEVQTRNPIRPYTNKNCQIELYRVLTALLKQRNCNHALPLHLIVKLLNTGANNVDSTISKICQDGLDLSEKISQPIGASLEIAIDQSTRNLGEQKQEIEEVEEQNVVENEVLFESNVEKEDEADLILTMVNNDAKSDGSIKILSNVIIQPPQKKLEEVAAKTVITNESKELNGFHIDTEFLNMEFVKHDHLEIERLASREINSELEAPPNKKKKENSPDIDDIFSTFQDIVHVE